MLDSFFDSPLFGQLGTLRRTAWLAHHQQRYGLLPYGVHLDQTAEVAWQAGLRDPLTFQAIYGHDILEDVPAILASHLFELGFHPVAIAAIEAVTDPAGPNRQARKALLYPQLIANAQVYGPRSLHVKLADRVANTSAHARDTYLLEYPEFRHLLRPLYPRDPVLLALWQQLDQIFTYTLRHYPKLSQEEQARLQQLAAQGFAT